MDIALREFDWKSIGQRLLVHEQDVADIGGMNLQEGESAGGVALSVGKWCLLH